MFSSYVACWKRVIEHAKHCLLINNDSVASYDFTPSEASFNPAALENGAATDSGVTRSRSKSRERSASGESAGAQSSHPGDADETSEAVPPVPPLPQGVVGRPPTSQTTRSRPSTRDQTSPPHFATGRRGPKSRGGVEGLFGGGSGFSGGSPSGASMDLQSLLKGIDSKSREGTLGNLTKPPY